MNDNISTKEYQENELKLKIVEEIGYKDRELAERGYREQVSFICNIVEKTKVLTFTQAVEMLRKTYNDLTPEQARKVIFQGEYDYHYLISSDLYLVDYDLYVQQTEDVFLDNINLNQYGGKCPIPFGTLVPKEYKEMLSCLSIVANYMPFSKNFFVTAYPFNITFSIDNISNKDEKPKGCVYELIYLSEDNLKTKLLTLRECFKIPTEYRGYMKRFAIIGENVDIEDIDYIGFERIFSVEEGQINVLEKRVNPWAM